MAAGAAERWRRRAAAPNAGAAGAAAPNGAAGAAAPNAGAAGAAAPNAARGRAGQRGRAECWRGGRPKAGAAVAAVQKRSTTLVSDSGKVVDIAGTRCAGEMQQAVNRN